MCRVDTAVASVCTQIMQSLLNDKRHYSEQSNGLRFSLCDSSFLAVSAECMLVDGVHTAKEQMLVQEVELQKLRLQESQGTAAPLPPPRSAHAAKVTLTAPDSGNPESSDTICLSDTMSKQRCAAFACSDMTLPACLGSESLHAAHSSIELPPCHRCCLAGGGQEAAAAADAG